MTRARSAEDAEQKSRDRAMQVFKVMKPEHRAIVNQYIEDMIYSLQVECGTCSNAEIIRLHQGGIAALENMLKVVDETSTMTPSARKQTLSPRPL